MISGLGIAHQRLRRETAALHGLLDSQLAPAVMTLEGYARYLRINYPCASIERALSAAGAHRVLPDWAARQRHVDLLSDLAALRVRPTIDVPVEIGEAPGTILGWAYVLEGSRLGAQVILRAVVGSGDREMLAATRFLRHGAGKALWPGFKAVLSRIDTDPVETDNACAAARAAFGCFLASAAAERV